MALVLSRKVGQSIVVDGPCTIKVAHLKGGRVTLALEAESTTRILRGELASDATEDPQSQADRSPDATVEARAKAVA